VCFCFRMGTVVWIICECIVYSKRKTWWSYFSQQFVLRQNRTCLFWIARQSKKMQLHYLTFKRLRILLIHKLTFQSGKSCRKANPKLLPNRILKKSNGKTDRWNLSNSSMPCTRQAVSEKLHWKHCLPLWVKCSVVKSPITIACFGALKTVKSKIAPLFWTN